MTKTIINNRISTKTNEYLISETNQNRFPHVQRHNNQEINVYLNFSANKIPFKSSISDPKLLFSTKTNRKEILNEKIIIYMIGVTTLIVIG